MTFAFVKRNSRGCYVIHPNKKLEQTTTGAHQGEPLSPLIPWVNPFPSISIFRTASSREKYHISVELTANSERKNANFAFLSRLWGLRSRGNISFCRFSPFTAPARGLLIGQILFFTYAIRRCAIFTRRDIDHIRTFVRWVIQSVLAVPNLIVCMWVKQWLL